MDANLWELVPSGSVDGAAVERDGQVSLERCVLTELEEETGIRASEVSPPRAIALVEDSDSHVTDVCLMLRTDHTAAGILKRFEALENREYTRLEVIAVDAIPEFRKQCGAALGGVTGALLDTVTARLRLLAISSSDDTFKQRK
jgi:8-oxo-dGTP pyrophosphatase MutT (NUDIX family)